MCIYSQLPFNKCNFFLKCIYFLFFIINFFKPFFCLNLVKDKPICYLSKNAITNFRSFPYLDFELSFPPVNKTGDFAILSNRRFKNKTAAKLVIKYKFKSRN